MIAAAGTVAVVVVVPVQAVMYTVAAVPFVAFVERVMP